MASEMIEEVDWDSLLPEDDIDLAANNWHNEVMDIMHTCIPQRTLTKRRNVPWITKNVICHIRKRNAVYQAAKRSPSTELTSKYRKLRNKVVKLLRNAKKSYLNNLDVRDKRKFWKTVKFLNKQQSSIPPLHHQGTTANSDHEKATMLNDFFSTCFNRTVPPLVPPNVDLNLHNDECPDDLLCLEGEVLSYIRLLDAAKASGPDGLSSRKAHQIALPHLSLGFSTSPLSLVASPKIGKLPLLSQYRKHQTTGGHKLQTDIPSASSE